MGGIAGLVALGGVTFWFLRRRQRRQRQALYDLRVDPIIETYTSLASGPTTTYASMSQRESAVIGTGSASGTRTDVSSNMDGSLLASRALLAKQAMVNDELKGEVNNLRRDLERIREERVTTSSLQGTGGSGLTDRDLPPPQYSDNVLNV